MTRAILFGVPALIVAAIAAYWATRPDLVVTVEARDSTLPSDVQDWVGKASRALLDEMESEQKAVDALREELSKYREQLADIDAGFVQVPEGERDVISSRIERAESKIADLSSRLERWRMAFPFGEGSPFWRPNTTYWHSREASVVTLNLTNESDHAIDDIRIKLTKGSRVWRMHARAAFLSAAEVSAFQSAFEPMSSFAEDSFVLPRIARLPAKQNFTLSLWGEVSGATAEIVTAEAVSVKTVPVIRVYDTGLASIFWHSDEWLKWWTAFFVPAIGAPLWLLAKWIWKKEIAAAEKKESDRLFGAHLFSFGKYFAKKGEEYHPAAVVLAVWAAENGFTKQQIRDEEAFRSLWADPTFRAVFGEPVAMLPGVDLDPE